MTVGECFGEVDFFIEAGGWTLVGIPTVEGSRGMGIAWTEAFEGDVDAGSGFQQGLSDIDVIEQLHGAGAGREVGDGVVDGEAGLSSAKLEVGVE